MALPQAIASSSALQMESFLAPQRHKDGGLGSTLRVGWAGNWDGHVHGNVEVSASLADLALRVYSFTEEPDMHVGIAPHHSRKCAGPAVTDS